MTNWKLSPLRNYEFLSSLFGKLARLYSCTIHIMYGLNPSYLVSNHFTSMDRLNHLRSSLVLQTLKRRHLILPFSFILVLSAYFLCRSIIPCTSNHHFLFFEKSKEDDNLGRANLWWEMRVRNTRNKQKEQVINFKVKKRSNAILEH